MITIFYDGQCGLCKKEISYYQRIAPKGVFFFEDITKDASQLCDYNITLIDALRLLHVVDDDGNLHIGVDAFLVIWRQLNYWRILARFVCLPIIYSVTKYSYQVFARWRFKRLTHCQVALNQEKK